MFKKENKIGDFYGVFWTFWVDIMAQQKLVLCALFKVQSLILFTPMSPPPPQNKTTTQKSLNEGPHSRYYYTVFLKTRWGSHIVTGPPRNNSHIFLNPPICQPPTVNWNY